MAVRAGVARRPLPSTSLRSLSRSVAAYPLFRCRERLPTNFPDQPFSPSPSDHRPTGSGTLAGGIVLPLDQTARRGGRIKAIYGTSENAVKIQVWVALSVYVLVAVVKKRLGLDLSLDKILQILSVTIFEKTPTLEGFFNFTDETEDLNLGKQLNLFEF